MARRDLRRHKVRALLACVLVALPVVVATVAALTSYNTRWDAEREASSSMGNADAEILVSGVTAVRARQAPWLSSEKAPGAERRDPATVDLATLLPQGSTIVPAGFGVGSSVPLQTGGQGWATVVDLSSDILHPLVRLTAGKAPSGPDEVSLDATTADQLGLLEADGGPVDGARLDLADGSALAVVGVVDSSDAFDSGGLTLVAGPGTRLLNERETARLDRHALVDLPDLTSTQLHDLVDDLAAAGVMMRPRDAVLHPGAWHLGTGSATDVTPVLVGALCILVGLLEVVLLVGAAFAVAARRQVRDLGLLSANGGAGGDVRRVLLAQGLVLGVGSSLVGVLGGMLLFRGATPVWEQIAGQEMWRQEVDWRAIVVIAVLGSLTSVVAALLPGWNVSRLTPVAALSGRFPVKHGESKAHRGAFVLAGSGLALVAGGGWLTARAFAPRASESPLGPFLMFLGLVLLVAGTVWATPYVVRQVARTGQGLPLSGRYAFRDAARHRFRSAAATMALTITIAGAVLAGFGFSAAASGVDQAGDTAPNTMTVGLYDGDTATDRLARVEATITEVVGQVSTVSSTSLASRDRADVTVNGRYSGVAAISEQDLEALLGPGNEEALAAFRDGSVVLVDPRQPRNEATFQVRPKRTHPDDTWTLPAVTVDTASDVGRTGLLGDRFISADTAQDLGLRAVYGQMIVHSDDPFTQEMIDRLRVYGIDGYSYDPERARVDLMQFSGLAAGGLLSALVVGVAVALAAAESRDDVATLAAVGAGPWRRRSLGAMHGLFLGLVGCLLGVAVGLPAGVGFAQLDGLSGVDVPWLATGGTLAAVLLAAPVAGWVVTPSRLRLTRRTA